MLRGIADVQKVAAILARLLAEGDFRGARRPVPPRPRPARPATAPATRATSCRGRCQLG
jgi:hypothetical protein